MSDTVALAGVLPPAALEPSGDVARWSTLAGVPEAVVSPQTTEEVTAVLRWASAEGVGVVPAGSGRRLGARVMAGRFIVLTTDRLTGIEIYEPADVTFTAKAGTTFAALAAELRANRQWLPFDPPDVFDRTLAGLVADGRSGPLWMGYGALRNHVLGATVVTGDGRVLHLGGRVVKNVAGFDLLRPIVGSRGTLGVITSVCMRAFPEPTAERTLELMADGLAELVPVAQAVGRAPVMPVSCELLHDRPEAEAGWADGAPTLRLRLHGASATVEADQRTLERHVGVAFTVRPGGSDEGLRTQARAPSDDSAADPSGTEVSISVRPSELVEAVATVEALAPATVSIDGYSADLRVSLAGFDEDALRSARDRVEALGGALSVDRAPVGVDAIGVSSRPNDDERRLAARVGETFDPQGVLWRRT